jgi:uncharacterized membrane protein
VQNQASPSCQSFVVLLTCSKHKKSPKFISSPNALKSAGGVRIGKNNKWKNAWEGNFDMPLTPLIAVHMTAAIGAVLIGPFALWARMGSKKRPWMHRAMGYAYATLMLMAAVSSCFILDFNLPNWNGYTLIHLLIPVTLISLWVAFRAIARRDFVTHRITMQSLYVGACLIAGGFTLLPSRYLGQLIWHEWLGWV